MSAMLRSQTPPSLAGVQVRCEVRARIPYPDGQFHLCLYRNSVDTKEHMAIVFGDDIESQSLNQPRDGEAEMDRLVRGARPRPDDPPMDKGTFSTPLVRIHSECFTGETVSSVRCDCGYQLAESMRLMQLEGRGVIIYLRQEGRGIGLLDKLRAYNLQDMGHDTVTANLMLAHPADARNYDLAYEMLRDLGLDQVRLLTNNPDKLQQMQDAGIDVVERVPMVPRWWQQEGNSSETDSLVVDPTEKPLVDSDSFSLSGGELTPVIAPQDGVGDDVYTIDGEDRLDTPRSNSSLSLGFQSKVDLSSDLLATHPDRPNGEPGLPEQPVTHNQVSKELQRHTEDAAHSDS
ncbi:GTP cyclohydrolase II [Dispira simplex]|nr:GTP cyclohydrolase II [Dispira simplex]